MIFLILGFGWLDLNREFLGIQNNLKIQGSTRVSRPRSSTNKVQLNLFCSCWIFQGLIFWSKELFGSPRDFFEF